MIVRQELAKYNIRSFSDVVKVLQLLDIYLKGLVELANRIDANFTMDRDGNFGIRARAFGGGKGVLAIKEAQAVPSSNVENTGILYVSGGHLYYRNPSGTVTKIAN